MTWRYALRNVAILANALFVVWLFGAAVSYSNDYLGALLLCVPPALAIGALVTSGARKSTESSARDGGRGSGSAA